MRIVIFGVRVRYVDGLRPMYSRISVQSWKERFGVVLAIGWGGGDSARDTGDVCATGK
jgi:hypothetical protein